MERYFYTHFSFRPKVQKCEPVRFPVLCMGKIRGVEGNGEVPFFTLLLHHNGEYHPPFPEAGYPQRTARVFKHLLEGDRKVLTPKEHPFSQGKVKWSPQGNTFP